MIIRALKYSHLSDNSREWDIIGNNNKYAYFGNINLFVGKNASGKSRTLNVLKEIADLISGKKDLEHITFPTQFFDVIFEDDEFRYNYLLQIKDRKVARETLLRNEILIFDRSLEEIFDIQSQKAITLDIDEKNLIITQKNEEGKPLYQKFYLWGDSMKNYLFSNQVEKKKLVSNYEIEDLDKPFIGDKNTLINTFFKGKENFGKKFISEVKACMNDIGYNQVTNIEIEKYKDGYGLALVEEERYMVSQREMSQGMFRALSFFIFLIYAKLSKQPLCILIDDVGEGLDYERSKAIISMVLKKIHDSNIQYFMTTNDRNVMNQIPLKYWKVIDKDKCKSIYYDYVNSKEEFDDFKYTGLSNFDFLTTDFYKNGFGELDQDING